VGKRKKLVLRKEAWDKLPSLLQDATTKFMVREVFYFDPPIELPPASPEGIHYRSDDHQQYLDYVREQLGRGVRDRGILRSFIVGLGGCGLEGRELIERIKTKLLK
jgi:hypothetical protein